jgi:hypothetical protein
MNPLFFRENTLHSLFAFSPEEMQAFPATFSALKLVYGPKRKMVLPDTFIIFPATIGMTAACRTSEVRTMVKIDVNFFRLQDKLTTLSDIVAQWNSGVYPEPDKFDTVFSEEVEKITDCLLFSGMFRTGMYSGLPDLRLEPCLTPLDAAYYAFPGMIFALAHEFAHLTNAYKLENPIALGDEDSDYAHIITTAPLYAIPIDRTSDFSRGNIKFSNFDYDEIRALPENILTEIKCDVAASADTIITIVNMKANIASGLNSVFWTLGVELLLEIAEAFIGGEESTTARNIRLLCLRDAILAASAINLTVAFLDPDNASPKENVAAFVQACMQHLVVRKRVLMALIYCLSARRASMVNFTKTPKFSDLRAACTRFNHSPTTTRSLLVNALG